MSIWKTTPVKEVPHLMLINWAIFELPNGDRHFAGYNTTEMEGRASSKIVQFDPKTRKGITNSGRVYELSGRPGLGGDGLYVWQSWCRINGVTDAKDVSSEI